MVLMQLLNQFQYKLLSYSSILYRPKSVLMESLESYMKDFAALLANAPNLHIFVLKK